MKFEFSWHLTREEAVAEAADCAAHDAGIPVTPELLKEADTAYDAAEEAAWEHGMERRFEDFWG